VEQQERSLGALTKSLTPAKERLMSNDEKRPSVGKDVVDPPPAPDNKRPNATPPPSNTPNPDPGYPSQSQQNKQERR
jgi:hypothetical protein